MSESTVPSGDDQDVAEHLDDDVVYGDDGEIVEPNGVTDPPDEWRGLPFVDADVTDESFEERTAQEEPDVDAADVDERFADPEPPIEVMPSE